MTASDPSGTRSGSAETTSPTAGDVEPEPYADDVEHLLDHLDRLDLLLRYRLEAWWAAGGVVDEFRGLYVADETVDRLLAVDGSSPGRHGPTGSTGHWDERRGGSGRERGAPAPGPDSTLLDRAAALADVVAARERASAAAGVDLRLVALAERVGLPPRAVDLLLVALAPALDPAYGTVYSYLQDDVTATRPTVAFALAACRTADGDPEDERRALLDDRRLLASSAPLVRERLVRLDGDGDPRTPFLSRRVVVDERVVAHLLGDDDLGPALVGPVAVVAPGAAPPVPVLAPEARASLDALLAAGRGEVDGEDAGSEDAGSEDADPDGDARESMTVVTGPAGTGRAAVAAALSRGAPVLAVEAAWLLDPDPALGRAEAFARLRREALLRGAAVHVRDLDGVPEADRPDLVRALDALPGPVVLSGTEAWRPRRPPARHALATLALPVPPLDGRRAAWEAALAAVSTSGPVDRDRLASRFRLTPGAVADAVASARAVAAASGDPVTEAALYEACRGQAGGGLGALATRVPTPYGWDDVVLPPDRLAQLGEVAARVDHRARVFDEWGFGEHAAGSGLVVLFSGPSGTGKTMAASVIAREAGLDCYRVDLSTVVSKYVGETEKNLSRIFDEAARGDAVLLFDEADALFGKRTEVRDAHDRYANVEVNYLLQRVERYDGVVVLTTNLRRNVDEAFTRRVHVHVEFPLPDLAAREAIWRGVFPGETPVADLDYARLARVELTGGEIRNAATTAAFLAADAAEPVGMAHVVQAVKRELRKAGKLVPAGAFEEYPRDGAVGEGDPDA